MMRLWWSHSGAGAAQWAMVKESTSLWRRIGGIFVETDWIDIDSTNKFLNVCVSRGVGGCSSILISRAFRRSLLLDLDPVRNAHGTISKRCRAYFEKGNRGGFDVILTSFLPLGTRQPPCSPTLLSLDIANALSKRHHESRIQTTMVLSLGQ